MTDPLEALATLYADVPGVVRRAGATYPVAVRPLPDGARLVVAADPVAVDPVLADGGAAHLAAVRAATGAHDGPVLCLDGIHAAADGTTVVVRRGGYFAMLASCDALARELDGARPAVWDALPLRRRAHDLAGDPFSAGHGRAAAFGVSVLLVVRGPDDAPAVVVGRRSARVAAGQGRWHVAPSGMLEESPDARHVAATVATELREELGVVRSVDDVEAGLRVLGLVTDLVALRPDLAVVLDLPSSPGGRPSAADLVAGPEFDDLDLVPLTAAGFAAFWAGRPPAAVTPPGAGALALLEEGLAGSGA